MATLMESKLTNRQYQRLMEILWAQTEAQGRLEIPMVEGLLIQNKCHHVLDIGCGEGAFLSVLARRLDGLQLTGIDRSELVIRDGCQRLSQKAVYNVELRTAFFDVNFDRETYDAILTRYTLQHASDPQGFMRAATDRLESRGLFTCIQSLDAYVDCHMHDPVWEGFCRSMRAIHARIGNNENLGESLGIQLKNAGLVDIQLRMVFCSLSTVGWERFRNVIQASADLAWNFFHDLITPPLYEKICRWLGDRALVERNDPYYCFVIASGTKPS